MPPTDEDPTTRAGANPRLVSPGDLDPDSGAVYRRLLGYAQRGMDDPAALSGPEINQVCRALVVHYAQLGIT